VAYNSNSNAGDGRLTMRDVSAVFYLGCDECSETIKTVDTDYVLDLMNVWANTYENED
jgi:hypothetical protein